MSVEEFKAYCEKELKFMMDSNKIIPAENMRNQLYGALLLFCRLYPHYEALISNWWDTYMWKKFEDKILEGY